MNPGHTFFSSEAYFNTVDKSACAANPHTRKSQSNSLEVEKTPVNKKTNLGSVEAYKTHCAEVASLFRSC
jgi:hypothetical protein